MDEWVQVCERWRPLNEAHRFCLQIACALQLKPDTSDLVRGHAAERASQPPELAILSIPTICSVAREISLIGLAGPRMKWGLVPNETAQAWRALASDKRQPPKLRSRPQGDTFCKRNLNYRIITKLAGPTSARPNMDLGLPGQPCVSDRYRLWLLLSLSLQQARGSIYLLCSV